MPDDRLTAGVIVIAIGAFFVMFRLKWNMILTLGLAAAVRAVYVVIRNA